MDTISHNQVKKMEAQLFSSLDSKNRGYITKNELIDKLSKAGIAEKNPRISALYKKLLLCQGTHKIKINEFGSLLQEEFSFIRNIFQGDLIIPEFKDFCQEIEEIYTKVKGNSGGKVADYIPQLGRVDPEKYAVSICTIDGQEFHLGDSKDKFCVQSSSKPFSYCMGFSSNTSGTTCPIR